MKTARQVTVESLMKVDGEGGYSQIVLDHGLKRSHLQGRDKGFATALFYGVLERRLTLDHYIAPFLRHKLTLVVKEILRISFYQLIFMESIPQNAVVNEAVELCRKLGQPGAAGMINGILRSFIRQGGVTLPEGDKLTDLEVMYSCPQELLRLLIKWYGLAKTRAILQSSFGQAETFLRVNTLKVSQQELMHRLAEEGVETKACGIENALSVSAGEAIASPLHQQGYYHIQDLSSQMAVHALDPQAGERVLDLCSAPGSKSFTIAQMMENRGEIISGDIYLHKLALITHGAERLGIKIISPIHQDATMFHEELGKFHRILCDVPCSGLGILRRKPEIKYKDVAGFKDLPAIQYKILETASNYLMEGGQLVYSTCTINPLENQEVVATFLQNHAGFTVTSQQLILPKADTGDGFFIATIRRI